WLRGRGIVFTGFRPCSGGDARAAVDFLGMPFQAIRMRKEGKVSSECGGTARPCYAIISGQIRVGGRFRRQRGEQAVAGALTEMQRLHLGAEIRLRAEGEGRRDGE